MTSPGRIAWIDAANGVAGDMLLGALVDAGVAVAVLQSAVDAVLPGTVALRAEEVRRAGMRATSVGVDVLVPDQPQRTWTTIRGLLADAGLDARVRDDALAVFGALAEAESRAHGIDVEDVHFHEVGAWDSIADIVGVCAGFADLGVREIVAGPVALGSGTVAAAHGRIPVPVPAVLELSRGWAVAAGGEGELTTPTGMALLSVLATPGSLPACRVLGVGVGAGTRDVPGRPNVVRVVVGEAESGVGAVGVGAGEVGAGVAGAGAGEVVEGGAGAAVVLDTNVDDLDPRVWPLVLEALLAAGASDAWLTPIVMKKGRPAHTLSVLAAPGRVDAVREAIFAQVPTLGVREYAVAKHEMDRLWREVRVGDSVLRIKVGHVGGVIRTATPEFVDVVAVAEASGRAVRAVLADAVAAASEVGLVVGEPLPH